MSRLLDKIKTAKAGTAALSSGAEATIDALLAQQAKAKQSLDAAVAPHQEVASEIEAGAAELDAAAKLLNNQ